MIVSAEYFLCYSDKFVIRFEAIIRAFPNKVFGFGHIPSADIVYLQQLQQVISNGGGGHSFSLRAVSMLIGQLHKWAELFLLSDVNRGRI